MPISSLWHRDLGATPRAAPTFEAFFSYGFRPFFLGAAGYAALFMLIWMGCIFSVSRGGADWISVPGGPYAWHAHEMIFGFAAAAIGGFLLTAVPNWTGALPISGAPLALLFLAWVAGRIAMIGAAVLPYGLVAALDLAFLPLLGAVAARQLFVKPAARNLVFLLLLTAMTAANAAFHAAASGVYPLDPVQGPRAALLIVSLMIAIIGGRIVPAFTHNWLHLNRPEKPRPIKHSKLDIASIASFAIFAAAAIFSETSTITGLAAFATAVLNGLRLYLWRGWLTLDEPIVWVLHLGYLWLVAGALLFAAACLTSAVPASIAFHAFSTGAAATMILAVTSRASLGHTGRALVAAPPIVASYGFVTLAALARTAGPLIAPQFTHAWLTMAALAWIAAFATFAAIYAPILTTPRVRSKAAAA
jgi:uncharacterized protein involved in response to NO